MARTVAIGIQDFEQLIEKDCFYVDKTEFIKEWWENEDSVTLITRPRRFGKTLNMNMLERFFSVKYSGKGDLFSGLNIWSEKKYRELQGTYPVISLSFANVKAKDYISARKTINGILANLYVQNAFLRNSGILDQRELEYFERISDEMDETDASWSLCRLSDYLSRYYGKKVLIFLDEYDTPMQEAYVNGYWDELISFTRNLFNSTFKTNPYMERAVMTGITRVSKESVFSDLNNLEIVTSTSDKYMCSFGFTENEVFAALDEYGLSSEKDNVKRWYDGFTFGTMSDIYNPWSALNFLDKCEYSPYWANTSANGLVGKLIREGDRRVKLSFEHLLRDESIKCAIDEQIVYNRLNGSEATIWSLLLASGYLKVLDYERGADLQSLPVYELKLTNHEVKLMFCNMVHDWFEPVGADYGDFLQALIESDIDAMNRYMNIISTEIFSYFDMGEQKPERFYHGFVLGLMVDLKKDYLITSNRESGFGRYDIVLEPRDKSSDAVIIEFKVHNPDKESDLEQTAAAALTQIDDKHYDASLLARGFEPKQIRKYGFAFIGKKVLIKSEA